MVRFQTNALIIEIPCEQGDAVNQYEFLQSALHSVYWLATTNNNEESPAAFPELNWLACYFGPAISKLAPEAKQAIQQNTLTEDPLKLPFERWKARYFPAMPDQWAMRFWLHFQKESNGPYAGVGMNETAATYERDRLLERIIEQAEQRDTDQLNELLSLITTPQIQ